MRRLVRASWVAIALCTTLPAWADERVDRIRNGLLPPIAVQGEPDTHWTLAARMKVHRVAGLSAAFMDHGQMAWTITEGVADAAAKRPVTSDTLFQAGAISTNVAAVAAMRLVQDGKLTLDDDVNARLTTWKLPETPVTAHEKVTLRRLLSHTAGLTVEAFSGYVAGTPLPTLPQILDGQPPASSPFIRVENEPGSEARFSAGGYALLQLLLKDVTGKQAGQLFRELVLAPAGMTSSTFEQPLSRARMRSAAIPHDLKGAPMKAGPRIYPELAADGLWTTPTDLVRFAAEVEQAWTGGSTRLLNRDTAVELLTRQKDNEGLGFALGGEEAWLHFSQSGTTEGYRAIIVAYPAQGQAFAAMTNGNDGMDLILELLRGVSREYGWPDYKPRLRKVVALPPPLLNAYAGVYEARGLRLVFDAGPGRLILHSPTGGADVLELMPMSDTTFFDREGLTTVTFQRGPDRVTSVIIEQDGSRLEVPRAPRQSPD